MNIVMTPALDKQIVEYLPLLGESEKQSLIGVIKSFIQLRKTEMSIDIEQYNNELTEAEAEYENGDYITHEQMKTEIKQWTERHTK
jgi:AAA+ ATPase superfamily predicted ATPase